MKYILILSQKGGVGKTTLADNLAFMLEAEGKIVDFYDMDPQDSALHETVEHGCADFAVLDTPGTLTEDTKEMIRDASVVVIPTRASALDMQPLERIRALVAQLSPNVPVLLVLNGYNRWTNARDFREWLEENLRSTETVAVLSQSEKIPQACIEGKSVVSYAPHSRPAEEMRGILQKIKEVLNG